MLVYASEGGFTHSDVYNMPVYLKRFYLKKLTELKKKEKERMDAQQSKMKRAGKR